MIMKHNKKGRRGEDPLPLPLPKGGGGDPPQNNLREVEALPEDSSRGVGAVKVPEKRGAGTWYLGRLGGDLIF